MYQIWNGVLQLFEMGDRNRPRSDLNLPFDECLKKAFIKKAFRKVFFWKFSRILKILFALQAELLSFDFSFARDQNHFFLFLTWQSDERSFRLTEIKFDVDERAVELDVLEKLAAEILEFLDSETEREEIRNQIKTIMKMSETIFATVAKYTREVTF